MTIFKQKIQNLCENYIEKHRATPTKVTALEISMEMETTNKRGLIWTTIE